MEIQPSLDPASRFALLATSMNASLGLAVALKTRCKALKTFNPRPNSARLQACRGPDKEPGASSRTTLISQPWDGYPKIVERPTLLWIAASPFGLPAVTEP
jgi:hypothetical protein